MDLMTIIAGGISLVFGILGTGIWTKIDKLLKALKELADVISVISKSLEDKKLTPEEIADIKKEIGEAIAAFRAILK